MDKISPSMCYAYAALSEGAPFIMGAPNTCVDVPAMYYYCMYYRRDEVAAQSFLHTKEAPFKPDSLTFYFKKAQYSELKGNDRQVALYYDKYNALIYQEHYREDHLLSLSFVPQLEYQKVAREKRLLLQSNAKIKLNELKSSKRLMALNAEHGRQAIVME